MSEQTEYKHQWYVLRVTYCRELIVKNCLDSQNIESYIPMHWEEKVIAGRKRRLWIPLVHNLIFVHITPEELRTLKAHTTLPVCYIMDRATKSPAVIPERQMQDFMALIAMQEQVEIVGPQCPDLRCGEMVRVTEGPFKGIEGRCVRIKGRSRVVVEIGDIVAAMTAYIPLKNLERI